MKEGCGRLALALCLLSLVWGLSVWGMHAAERRAQEREAARRRVTAALAEREPGRAAELFRQARAFEDVYGACEDGALLERRGRLAEAAEKFRACRDGDPGLLAAHLVWAEALVRAEGKPAYADVRAHLRRVDEAARRAPVTDPETLQSLEGLILDLEELMADDAPPDRPEGWTVEELVRILTRKLERGSSRYEGPRVPLRLDFRPGDATLGRAAETQLQEVARALRDGRLAATLVQIEGHTDSVESGTEAGRDALGRRRAEAVRDVLVRSGISRERLQVRTLGDLYPLASNRTLAGRNANRRFELFNLDEGSPVWSDVRRQK
jgi:outer membrane protein OmpA-like peptidoglycan-associated protein